MDCFNFVHQKEQFLSCKSVWLMIKGQDVHVLRFEFEDLNPTNSNLQCPLPGSDIVYRFQMKHKNLIYGLVQESLWWEDRKTQKCRPIWCNTHKWYFFEFKFKQCVRCLLTTACFIMTTMCDVAEESSLSESLTKRRFWFKHNAGSCTCFFEFCSQHTTSSEKPWSCNCELNHEEKTKCPGCHGGHTGSSV